MSYAPFTKMGFGCQGVSQRLLVTLNHWVSLMQRWAFEGLEPCDGKLSRTVLRGLGVSNDPRLPGLWNLPKLDPFHQIMYARHNTLESHLI